MRFMGRGSLNTRAVSSYITAVVSGSLDLIGLIH